jgi:hypothetical protein
MIMRPRIVRIQLRGTRQQVCMCGICDADARQILAVEGTIAPGECLFRAASLAADRHAHYLPQIVRHRLLKASAPPADAFCVAGKRDG